MEYFFKEKSFPTSEILTIPCLPSISAAALSIADGIECDEIEFIKLPASFLGEYQNVENLIAFKKIGESMDLLFPDGSPIVAKKMDEMI
jgi:hypothetical protein